MTYLGGLDSKGSDGKFTYIWQDEVLQCKCSLLLLYFVTVYDNYYQHSVSVYMCVYVSCVWTVL